MSLAVVFVTLSVCHLYTVGNVLTINERYTATDYYFRRTENREKRTSTLSAKGTVALKTLLIGAERAKTGRSGILNPRRYVKDGKLDTALQDFYSIRYGSEVKEFHLKKGKALLRHAGDRQFTLFTAGDRTTLGHPFLEVMGRGHLDARIVYKDLTTKKGSRKN